MSCTIKEIKDAGLNKVKTKFKGEAKGIVFDGNIATINYGFKHKLKTLAQATSMAREKITAINRWSFETFKTNQFKDQWADMYSEGKVLKIKFGFPAELEEAYNIKLKDSAIDNIVIKNSVDETFKVTPQDRIGDELGDIVEDVSLVTIEQRLNDHVNRILDVLEAQIRIAQKKKRIEGDDAYLKRRKEIKRNVEEFKDVDNVKGIATFTRYMDSQLKSLHKKFDENIEKEVDDLAMIHQFESYSAAYSLIEDIEKLFIDSKYTSEEFNKEDKKIIQDNLNRIGASYSQLNKKYLARTKKIIRKTINDPQFHSDVVYNVRETLKKEYNTLYPQGKGQKEWVAKKLNSEEYKEIIANKVEEKVDSILYDIGDDISGMTKLLVDDLNTNNKLIQIVSTMLSEIRDRIVSRTREKNHELGRLFDEFKKGRTTTNLEKMYEKLLDTDSEGNRYLYGEWNPEWHVEKQKQVEKLVQVEKEFGMDNEYYVQAQLDYYKWMEDNTQRVRRVTKEDGKVVKESVIMLPSNDWKSKPRKLSEIEQKVLDAFKTINTEGHERTHGINSLVKTYGGAEWHKLPSVTKSDLERIVSDGKPLSALTEKWHDLTELRPDDVGYGDVPTMIDNTAINFIPIHYRKRHKRPSDQSIDLFYIFSLENKNTISYQEKQEKELELHAIREITKSKKYYGTKGMSNARLRSFFSKNVTRVEKKGEDSNIYAKVQGMIENQLYDITNKYAGPVLGITQVDFNKVANTINGLTASIGMGMNFMGGIANVVTGNLNTTLEAIAGDKIKGKHLAKAIKVYTSESLSGGVVADIGKPVKRSKLNQINEMFDVFGHNNIIGQDFLKSNKMKSMMDSSVLTFMYSAGEHEIQSVLTLSILESIKVQNKNNEYIDKKGNPVKYEKAASMLDMIEFNKKNEIKINDNVVYTEFTPITPLNEGGKAHINSFIKKKIFDTQGVYDNRFKSEAQRTWIGSMAFLFRRYLISSVQRRLKGLDAVTKSKDMLTDKDRHWNEAIKDYDEGSYVSFTRFLLHSVVPSIRKFQYDLMTKDWENMSDLEKGNVKRTMVELILIFAILPTLSSLAAAMGDDEDERWYYLAYQLRRQQSELGQYMDINEAWRIMQSPAASVRTLNHIVRNIYSFVNVTTWNDRYETGKHKGELKAKHYMFDLIPVISRLDVTPRESYNWIDK